MNNFNHAESEKLRTSNIFEKSGKVIMTYVDLILLVVQ
jgi:hypothetical protein